MAFVTNGFFVSPPLPIVIAPTMSPIVELNSKARPRERLFARMHGFWAVGVASEPPACERQP